MKLNEIKVSKLNVEKLNEDINSHLKESEKGECDFDYRLPERNLCVATSDKGTVGIFDMELCGELVEGTEIKFEVIRQFHKGSRDMFPVKMVGVSLVELQEYIDGSINVEEFMGQRFNYNSRIKSNQNVFLNFIINE